MTADVLILGAGAAGLRAAASLSAAGRHVIVLEARDRIGGRLLTRRHVGQPLPVELGPEFVHGKMPETFGLLRAAGLIAYDVTAHHITTRRGRPVSQDDAWQKAEVLLERLGSLKNDCSFADFLRRHAARTSPTVRRLATSFVEGFNAADRRLISCRSLVKATIEESKHEDGDKQFRLIGGYDQLAGSLATRVVAPSTIQLSTVVQRVRWQREHVEVDADTADGPRTFTAPCALIALPLGVLQVAADARDGIRFDPELPTLPLLQTALIAGSVVKLTVRFNDAFWEARGMSELSFVHRPDVPFPTWWTTLPLRTPLLTGWAGGPAAEHVMAGDGIVDAAVRSLAEIFAMSRRTISKLIAHIDHHDWQADPFSRGAYSYARVGGADAPGQLARPISGTLFFAGEHTHGGLLGTVAGALHSGEAAAQRILRKRR